ncbi:unnamed protein product [Prorocentrum cordatum]|uniref:Uncharacterized protein n=1 Tax=Prorocentrum cordatum TaxID=2364126 RepID=A0ABN9VET8_9DINO|nr:unnamed protein product [Polarella glacialis]
MEGRVHPGNITARRDLQVEGDEEEPRGLDSFRFAVERAESILPIIRLGGSCKWRKVRRSPEGSIASFFARPTARGLSHDSLEENPVSHSGQADCGLMTLYSSPTVGTITCTASGTVAWQLDNSQFRLKVITSTLA